MSVSNHHLDNQGSLYTRTSKSCSASIMDSVLPMHVKSDNIIPMDPTVILTVSAEKKHVQRLAIFQPSIICINFTHTYTYTQTTRRVFCTDFASIPSKTLPLHLLHRALLWSIAYQSSACCNIQQQHFNNGASPETRGDENNQFQKQLGSCVPHAI